MRRVIGIVLLLVTIWSCKKEESDYTAPSSYLTGGGTKEWVLTEMYVNGAYVEISDCAKDDTLYISSDKTFRIVGEETPCNTFVYMTGEEGDWRVSSDDKIFYLFGTDQFGYEAKINKLTNTRFESTKEVITNTYKYVYETVE